MNVRCFACWFFSLLAFFPVTPARARIVCPDVSTQAEQNKNEARRYFNMGRIHFEKGDYELSAASFLCVIQLVPYSLTARVQLARSYDKAGRYSLAREQYNWVLLDPSDEAEALKSGIQTRLAEIADLPDTAPDPATEPKGDVKPAPAPVPALTSRWWFWAGVGTTAAFAGATAFFGYRALDGMQKWDDNRRWVDREMALKNRTYADIALAGTLVSAGALVFGIWKSRGSGRDVQPNDTKGAAWWPACGPEGCMLVFSLGF